MLKVEALRDELVKVSQEVGKHKEVSEKAGISVAYLDQIRKGKNAKTEKEENKKLLKLLISIYRSIGKDKLNALKQVLN
jgi:transcriptional regulator with XRE-family HTH domain